MMARLREDEVAMDWHGWLTVTVLAATVAALVRYENLADVIFVGALTTLTVCGVISPADAMAGFKNEGMLTVGALFVVAAGLTETGLLSRVTRRVLGHVGEPGGALRRMVPVAVVSSAFLNNTAIVAMGIPALLEWSRKNRVAASRVLLPLSYAAILGGVCTLIGTSTNLVVHGLMRQSGLPALSGGLGMWEISRVGVPIAAFGALYLVFVAPRFLPDRKEFLDQLMETRREYLAEIHVEARCPLVGQTVQAAGLRGLPGLYLIEIERAANVIAPVGPDEVLAAGDRLVFTGVVSTLVDLQRVPGLVPATALGDELEPGVGRHLCEAVISTSSPLVGQRIRDASFRTVYDAAVVAVHRNGRRIPQKIGDVRLEPGDTLLLQTGTAFVRIHRNNPDFFLVSEVGDSTPPRHERAYLAVAITVGLVALMTLPDLLRLWPSAGAWAARLQDLRVVFTLLAACLMVATRCLSVAAARRSVEWNVLIVIAAALGIGTAMSQSGAAEVLARAAIGLVPAAWGSTGVLAAIYLLTWLLTELMSNNAAAALMFPIGVAAAQQSGGDLRAFAVAVAVGASSGFVMPIGYQTHLMVFGPGGYRVADFVRAGVPMVVLWFVVTVLVVPLAW
jgi:di/tricarboxylate transporter